MKLKSLIFVGLLALTSCANQSSPFYIEKFYPLGAGCDIEAGRETAIAGNGYLDVAASSPQFFVGIRVVGADLVAQNAVVQGNITLEQENRDRPLVKTQVVTYRLSKPLRPTPKPYVTNISIPFIEGELFGAFQLISPDLGTALVDTLQPSATIAEDFVDITADVEFKGEYANSKNPFTTGTLSFPIRAFRSNPPACTNGYVRFPENQATGLPDFCNYVGQTPTQLIVPPQPSCCVAVGAPGC